jgi:DNA-binding transcriptional MerR regulator
VVGSDVVAKNRSLLGGTVAQAKAEIARRIGDSSGAVSSGAAAIEHALTQGLEDERKLRQRFFDEEQQTFAQVIDARKAQGLSAAEIAAMSSIRRSSRAGRSSRPTSSRSRRLEIIPRTKPTYAFKLITTLRSCAIKRSNESRRRLNTPSASVRSRTHLGSLREWWPRKANS